MNQNPAMGSLDVAYLLLIAAGLGLDHFVFWPCFMKETRTNPRRARRHLWLRWMIMLWALTGAGIALWWSTGRPWTGLRLGLPGGWRLALAWAVIVALATMQAAGIRKIARLPADRPVRFGSRHNELAPMLPHTRREWPGFAALSLTAGCCEEFLFRGYLIWAGQAFLGTWGAAAASSLVFGLAHGYQGIRGVLSTCIMGALLAALVLLTGSLWPAIVVHTQLDAGHGWIAWMVLSRQEHRVGSSST